KIAGTFDNFALKLVFPSVASYVPPPPGDCRHRKTCRRLLLIDDDLDNLELLKPLLELRGFNVTTASSGFEALRMLDSNRAVDSVICDLGMPGMNGWDVAANIAHISPGTPVYLVTGWAENISLADARRNLVKAVLGKPINLEELDRLLLKDQAN
ncbi:MAG: response regulator, partial [Alphaproteobacteria bacterium]|nr:response regulator [Alphaproteobacteria bacterium]